MQALQRVGWGWSCTLHPAPFTHVLGIEEIASSISEQTYVHQST